MRTLALLLCLSLAAPGQTWRKKDLKYFSGWDSVRTNLVGGIIVNRTTTTADSLLIFQGSPSSGGNRSALDTVGIFFALNPGVPILQNWWPDSTWVYIRKVAGTAGVRPFMLYRRLY